MNLVSTPIGKSSGKRIAGASLLPWKAKPNPAVLNTLAWLIIALSVIQAVGGLFLHDLYRDGP